MITAETWHKIVHHMQMERPRDNATATFSMAVIPTKMGMMIST